ncbi:mRNA splicing protein yju2 [Grosmannia clavigera kw1407]|uniref:Splicing factor YJU2 n=1 Tax=Grosmannia clavigera (strain kw1407 / UAMH 11150) TaxID=655863 RepID=F0XLJ8_GROCL|nr:mRNA splicing protein yju2 [Grosmannia clavigera kw1407]EFX01505.1 mRNA splicing protein yju2 [Grosmannia clavigera kw1407]
MSERKVLTKYYPADFDPSVLERRSRKPKNAGPAVQVVRLMAPMSMRCTRCGEYIYKGRKFNARKETPEDLKYLGVQMYRFYIRCTRCSAEIIFRSDPKNQDYAVVSGAKRNVEPWRQAIEESDEQRLDRLEAEEAEANGEAVSEQSRMEELEAKTLEAKREMDVADALDEIRTRNARIARADHRDHLEAVALARPSDEEERLRQQDREDEEAARKAFAAAAAATTWQPDAIEIVDDDMMDDNVERKIRPNDPLARVQAAIQRLNNEDSFGESSSGASSPSTIASPRMDAAASTVPSFKRQVKKKKNHAALLGIKKKPSLV